MRKPLFLFCLLLLWSAFDRSIEAQWKKASFPSSFTDLRSLAWLNEALYAGVDTLLYRSTDNGDSWRQLSGWNGRSGLIEVYSQFAGKDSTLIAAIAYRPSSRIPLNRHFHAVRSTDGGLTWRDANTFSGHAPGSMIVTNGRIIVPHYGTVNSVIHFSTNAGISWDSTKNQGLGSLPHVDPIDLLAKDTMLFLTIIGTSIENSLFKSTDYGETWTPINTGFVGTSYRKLLLVGDALFAAIEIDSYSGGTAAIVSTDNGTTWAVLRDLSLDPDPLWTDGKSLFGSIKGAVAVSTNLREPGILWDEGLPKNPDGSSSVHTMAFSEGFAFAIRWDANSAGGEQQLWRRSLSELVTGSDKATINSNPYEFSLFQNYPNPFNPSTTVRYGLPCKTTVQLSVFNTLGQQVALLQNEELDAGFHQVQFDASGLSSGVYFYRLRAGDFLETKRLLLLR